MLRCTAAIVEAEVTSSVAIRWATGDAGAWVAAQAGGAAHRYQAGRGQRVGRFRHRGVVRPLGPFRQQLRPIAFLRRKTTGASASLPALYETRRKASGAAELPAVSGTGAPKVAAGPESGLAGVDGSGTRRVAATAAGAAVPDAVLGDACHCTSSALAEPAVRPNEIPRPNSQLRRDRWPHTCCLIRRSSVGWRGGPGRGRGRTRHGPGRGEHPAREGRRRRGASG